MTDFLGDQSVFARLISRAEQTEMTAGTSESLTGGLLGFVLARQEGAGEAFAGSIVAYQTEVKQELLDVSGGSGRVIPGSTRDGPVTCRLLNCEVAVSLTGVAGPESQEGKPVGTVFIALADRQGDVNIEEHHLDGSPDTIRLEAARMAATLALAWLSRQGESEQ